MADARLTLRQRWAIPAIAIATVVATLAAIAVVYALIQHHRTASQATVTITVVDKRADPCPTPTSEAAASCTWRIFTDAGVFADRNEVTAHKLNSRDLFDQLMYGGVYEVEVRGTRHDNLGVYPNIIKIVKVISQGHPNPAVVIIPSA